MSDLQEAAERLRRADEACQAIPLWLPFWIYKRRLNAAMREWNSANLAMFDAEVAASERRFSHE